MCLRKPERCEGAEVAKRRAHFAPKDIQIGRKYTWEFQREANVPVGDRRG